MSRKDSMPENIRAYWHLIRGRGRSAQGDIVHAWHTRGLEWAYLLGRRWNVPASGTLHDDPSPPHSQFGFIRKKIIHRTAARLDAVAAVSDAVGRRCDQLGWNREIAILRNGLPDEPPVQRAPSANLRLGFMATGILWKGIELIPRLVERTADLPVEWNLFGSREDTGAVLDPLSTMPRVRYFGRVPLHEALPRIDILLHLSLNLDPYPTVLLEAARAGIPVIATSTGGSPEIVADGETGILVPPGDAAATERAIRDLQGAPERRESMSRNARKRFEDRFRVERMVADYFAFWDRLRSAQP
jgi:glycosyltransferase involved in cell wall biosynthesis